MTHGVGSRQPEHSDEALLSWRLDLIRNEHGYTSQGALLDLLLSQKDVIIWPGIPGNVAGENEGGYES